MLSAEKPCDDLSNFHQPSDKGESSQLLHLDTKSDPSGLHLDTKSAASGLQLDTKSDPSGLNVGDIFTEGKCFVDERDDFLEVSLCGNDTKLYVRETTEELKPKPVDETESDGDRSLLNISKASHITVVSALKSERSDRTERTDQPGKQLQALYTKKWSGRTYFEEELRRIRDNEYEEGVEEGTKKRRLWKKFQRELKKESRRDLIRSSGPAWWQEPSTKQIMLATNLGDVIKADHEEGVTGRTRQWLLDLGITTRFTPKQVQACMRKSLLEPVDFLLESHSVVLKSQMNVKKTRGDLERPFSINERIILSAVCVLHLPTLLTILHYILPPPEHIPESEFVQELLYGDLSDESIRFATPYMEPLPFRNARRFNDWAFEGVFQSFLPTILREEQKHMRTPRPTRATLTSAKMSVVSQSRIFCNNASRRLTEGSERSPTVAWLISHYASRRRPSESMVAMSISDSDFPRFFSRNLTKKSTSRRTSDPRSDSLAGRGDREVPRQGDGKVSFGFGSQEDRLATLESTRTVGLSHTTVENPSRSFASGESDQTNTTDSKTPEQDAEIQKNVGSDNMKSIEVYFTEDESKTRHSLINEELQRVWEEVKDLPEKKQLRHTFKILAGLGDPLAQLPRLDTLLTVRRWLELRKGKNRILSKGTKEELLRRSRAMWKVAPAGCDPKGPKIPCSKRVERKLTWDKKNWLSRKVGKEMDTYCTRVRQEKVDNARSFFPTMLNHYDHGSKLNRNFRNLYFTYMPAREADTFVYKPWQPMEVKGN